MTKQIGTTVVPDDLYTYARFLREKGAMVFLSIMDVDHTGAFPERGCTNCNDSGRVALEWYVTAGMDYPVVLQPKRDEMPDKNPVTAMWDEKRGKWFGKKMRSYPCPCCSLEQPKMTVKQPAAVNL
jgi:hypothetical protein